MSVRRRKGEREGRSARPSKDWIIKTGRDQRRKDRGTEAGAGAGAEGGGRQRGKNLSIAAVCVLSCGVSIQPVCFCVLFFSFLFVDPHSSVSSTISTQAVQVRYLAVYGRDSTMNVQPGQEGASKGMSRAGRRGRRGGRVSKLPGPQGQSGPGLAGMPAPRAQTPDSRSLALRPPWPMHRHRRWAVQTWIKPWSPGSLARRQAIALDLPRCKNTCCNGNCAQHNTTQCNCDLPQCYCGMWITTPLATRSLLCAVACDVWRGQGEGRQPQTPGYGS